MGVVFFSNPGLLKPIISQKNGPTGLSIAQVGGGDSETEAPSFQMTPSRVAFTNISNKSKPVLGRLTHAESKEPKRKWWEGLPSPIAWMISEASTNKSPCAPANNTEFHSWGSHAWRLYVMVLTCPVFLGGSMPPHDKHSLSKIACQQWQPYCL